MLGLVALPWRSAASLISHQTAKDVRQPSSATRPSGISRDVRMQARNGLKRGSESTLARVSRAHGPPARFSPSRRFEKTIHPCGSRERGLRGLRTKGHPCPETLAWYPPWRSVGEAQTTGKGTRRKEKRTARSKKRDLRRMRVLVPDPVHDVSG